MPVLDTPAKESAILVEFEYGEQAVTGKTGLQASITEDPPDIENDYTENDPGGVLTVAGSTVTFVDADWDNQTMVYKDYGADHFSMEHDWQFKFSFQVDDFGTTEAGLVCFWGLSDVLQTRYQWQNNPEEALCCFAYGNLGVQEVVGIEEFDGVGGAVRDTYDIIEGTKYWVDLTFDADAGTYGTITAKIYTDAFVTLVDTLTVVLTHTVTYRYLFVYNGFDSGSTGAQYETDGFVEHIYQNFLTDDFDQQDIARDATVERFTNWDSDLVHPDTGETFYSLPEMEVDIPKLTGMLKEKPLVVKVPQAADQFFDDISTGEPFDRTTVRVCEWAQTEDQSEGDHLTLFSGVMMRVFQNVDGTTAMIRVECEAEKMRMKGALGIVATHNCPWGLGDANCDPDGTDIDIESEFEVGVVDAIDGVVVTISELDPNVTNRHFHRGYVRIGTLRIGIRDWLSGEDFVLFKIPPADWDSELIQVVPGCDKEHGTCDTLWSNTEHFGGIGYGIPDYHPVIEQP